MNAKRLLLILISCVWIASCVHNLRDSNEYMAVGNAEKEYFPSEGKALLIVERTQEVNLSGYDMVVWKITDRLKPQLIGYLAASMKAAYELDPGEHTLLLQMALTNNAMKLTVEAGKTYFTKIGTKGYGIYFFPVKKGQVNDVSRKNISNPGDNLVAWGRDRERIENSLQSRIDKGLGKWSEMSDEDMVLRNMDLADGR
ncbi:MAG: DUF2846 domain-containing protein [Pseudomonadales bacterium]|nr:DUF2846 domain-containing protein [Pseudomonadales bacterium]